MIKYVVTENKLNIDDEILVTYGISAVCDGKVIKSFCDVSTDKDFVLTLTYKLNFYEVELCHFYDIIIDELNTCKY